MQFSVENLCGLLIRSKLLTPAEVKSMYERWQAEAKDKSLNTNYFTKWIVAKKYLTDYQASLIGKGHADDFFLNEYRILDRLGRGRMAGVYKAMHHLGQTVAIKVLPPSRAKNAQMMGRFQRESRLTMKLKHPNVIRAFQVGTHNGLHYIVMEYLEGETLEDVLKRRKRLPHGEAVRLVHQALLGLQHIHEQGMIHRDLKPSNLMLTPASVKGLPDTTINATVKILDIGLGREMFDENAPQQEVKTELTQEGVLLGTPDYLAPEQARDPRSIDIRADIYSIGCVLYHCLAGHPPFPDDNLLNQMVRHATEPLRPIREINPQVPDGLQQILNWMAAKKPEERYPTPERAAQALQVFMLAEPTPAKSLEDAQPNMRKYLTWLEGSKGDGEKSTPTPQRAAAAPVALAKPAVAEKQVSHSTSAPKNRKAESKKAKKRKKPSSTPIPVARPHAPPVNPAPAKASPATAGNRGLPPNISPDDIDVELVPTSSHNTSGEKSLGLTKREWLLIGITGGLVLAIAGVIILLMNVL